MSVNQMTEFYQAHEVIKAKDLLEELIELYDDVVTEGNQIFAKWKEEITRSDFEESARNLSYYLALRQRDIRGIQKDLVPWGLSSLGRLEAKTLSTLEAVISALSAIVGDKSQIKQPDFKEFSVGEAKLASNIEKILGQAPSNRYTRIMVTMPSEVSEDIELAKNLISKGMNVARINCAHDNTEIWQKMIHNIRKSAEELGKDVKILMDIAGPKIRTEWIYTTYKKPKVSVSDKICLTTNNQMLPTNQEVKVTVGTSVPEIINQLSVGDPVLIDDGSIESIVESINEEEAILLVKRVSGKSIRLKAEKGLNFPGLYFDIDILTDEDLDAMKFAVEHADIIGCSFIRDVKDVEAIQAELDKLLGNKAGTVALLFKIETVQAVNNLTQLILKAASRNPLSIMIARGDLAVETGYIRLAEVQQQIMWICEAANIPVVWGTEVLANMLETGIPSRAEVTDAAEGARSDCVMINKGNYMLETVTMLDEILHMMKEHQFKKTPKLRALSIAKNIMID